MHKLTTFLWFDHQAEEAATFYTSIFPNSQIQSALRYGEAGPGKAGTVMTITFTLEGQEFTAINGGPHFTFTPATSFFVNRSSVEAVDTLIATLAEGGQMLVEPGSYPFSPRFAWVVDRFGISWQISLGEPTDQIMPFLMFTGAQSGKTEEAVSLYAALFPQSAVENIMRFDPPAETTLHATFSIHGQRFMAIDSAIEHAFGFTQAISFMIHCEDQEEVDRYWHTLTDGGEEQACGWLVDRYGVTWQIVPTALMTMLSDPDPERAQRVTQAMLQMKKIDLPALEAAYAMVSA